MVYPYDVQWLPGFYKYDRFDEYKLSEVLSTPAYDTAAKESEKTAQEERFWSKSFLLRSVV